MPCCYQLIAEIGDFTRKIANRWNIFSEGFLWEYRVVFNGCGEIRGRIGLVDILTNGITTSKKNSKILLIIASDIGFGTESNIRYYFRDFQWLVNIPHVRVQDVLNCSFSVWYPLFEKHTIKR